MTICDYTGHLNGHINGHLNGHINGHINGIVLLIRTTLRVATNGRGRSQLSINGSSFFVAHLETELSQFY